MTLEKDPIKVAELAAQQDDDNWKFRSFLKGMDMAIEDIDSIVHELYERVATDIDCRECANCCKKVRPVLKRNDIKRLAKGLRLSPGDFEAQYLEEDDEEGGYFLKSQPCPFLKENLCTVYPDRPNDCRSYPHLHKNEFVFRLWGVVDNCAVCPIVYNVYEKLKEKLWCQGSRGFRVKPKNKVLLKKP